MKKKILTKEAVFCLLHEEMTFNDHLKVVEVFIISIQEFTELF